MHHTGHDSNHGASPRFLEPGVGLTGCGARVQRQPLSLAKRRVSGMNLEPGVRAATSLGLQGSAMTARAQSSTATVATVDGRALELGLGKRTAARSPVRATTQSSVGRGLCCDPTES